MCIRDRLVRVPAVLTLVPLNSRVEVALTIGETTEVLPLRVVPVIVLAVAIAVSYTHLDVYKRQHLK